MLTFFKKLFKKGKNGHQSAPANSESIRPLATSVSSAYVQSTVNSTVSVYGTRTKETAIKVRPKHNDEDQDIRTKNTTVKVKPIKEENAIIEKAKEISVSLKAIKDEPKPETMQEELLRKAKELRDRTHNHNKYYRGVGKDIYGLNGRELKSIFENDNAEKLPYADRAELMRELQNGTRKHTWR